MFERFTDRSRRVLVLAQEEAMLLDHNFIGTEHLLLGLIREEDGIAAKALASVGVRLAAARSAVETTVSPSLAGATGSPPFTPRAKKVLELSLREALQLRHHDIGTEHLLLALVREGEGVAVQVLLSLGVDLSELRGKVIRRLGYQPGESTQAPMVSELRGEGPRCPACRAMLEGHVAYRVLSVAAAEQGPEQAAIDVRVVYCLECGVVIPHAPTDRD